MKYFILFLSLFLAVSSYDKAFQVIRITEFDLVWNDGGSGADSDVSVWRPRLPDNSMGILSHVVLNHYGKPSHTYAFRAFDKSDITFPAQYVKTWNDGGSGSKMDGQFWKPIPYPGYVCPGVVGMPSYFNYPSYNSVICFRDKYAVRVPGDKIWGDHESGANLDGSFWGHNWGTYEFYKYYVGECVVGYTRPEIQYINPKYLIEMNVNNIVSVKMEYDYSRMIIQLEPRYHQSKNYSNPGTTSIEDTYQYKFSYTKSKSWEFTQSSRVEFMHEASISINVPIKAVSIDASYTFRRTDERTETKKITTQETQTETVEIGPTKFTIPGCTNKAFRSTLDVGKATIPFKGWIHFTNGQILDFDGYFKDVEAYNSNVVVAFEDRIVGCTLA